MTTDNEKKDNPEHVTDSKPTDKNRYLIIIIVIVFLLIGAVVFFVFKSFQTKPPTQSKVVINSPAKFFKTNPFKAKVNPFKDIKTNPFR